MAKRSLTNAVLYLRMSADQQEQSIPSQGGELTAYAKKHGYKIVGEYIDEAISGGDTHKRTGFLQMRDDAQSGKFEVVLCSMQSNRRQAPKKTETVNWKIHTASAVQIATAVPCGRSISAPDQGCPKSSKPLC